MNKLIILTTILILVSMFSVNNAATQYTTIPCKLQMANQTNDAGNNGDFKMNIKLIRQYGAGNSMDIVISKGNNYSFWDDYNVHYGGQKLYISYKTVFSQLSVSYHELCKQTSIDVSIKSKFRENVYSVLVSMNPFYISTDYIEITFTKL
ncbi:hypothetical protein ACTFIW_007858 [Dictyostelium discoideum]